MNKIGRPYPEDAPPHCPYFFNLVEGDDLLIEFRKNQEDTLDLIRSIPISREDYRYAEEKWSLKMVLIHLIDSERFYAYRALCSSRQVDIDLEFNREQLAQHSNGANRGLKDIAEEFGAVREATISLYSTMTPQMLDFKGFPNKRVYTARSFGWMTVGHTIHHCNMIREKYLR